MKGKQERMSGGATFNRCLFVLSIAVAHCMAGRVSAQVMVVDTLTQGPDVRCLRNTGFLVGASVVGTLLVLDQAWYAEYERSPMHSFDDRGEWLQMDKAGHLFSAYALGSWGHALMQHCGASRSASRWVGGSLGLVFLTGVELLDGTSAGWGFSWSDMAANVMGTGLFIGQDGTIPQGLQWADHLAEREP
jgi:uncharacterized protein YfiM (DUF2279 family)